MIIAFTYDYHNDPQLRKIYYGGWTSLDAFRAWAQLSDIKQYYPNAKAVPQRCLDKLHIKPADCGGNILLSKFLNGLNGRSG